MQILSVRFYYYRFYFDSHFEQPLAVHKRV
jgi:hypothetical protein